MYYKITNKDSNVYKELYALRTKEIEIEEENKESILNVVGRDWENYLGRNGQQNLWRVTRYTGFAFKNPDRLPPKTWKQHKEYHDIYVPDPRTKNGKIIKKFLDELPHSSFHKVFSILECEPYGQFAFPYVEIGKDDVIILYMSDCFNDKLKKNKDIIEITSVEFNELNK